MKDYHFQENEQDFGLTVRLDDINEKVKQLKQTEPDDDLGDANAFLNAFESEKFDTLQEETEDDTLGDTQQNAPVKKVPPVKAEPIEDEEEWEEYDEEEKFGMSKKTIGLLAALAVLACIIGFSLVRCSFHPASVPVEPSGNGVPMLVESVLDEEEILVYDITEEDRLTLALTEKTQVIDEDGRSVAYGGVEAGDLVMVELDKDGKTALSLDYSSEAIQTQEATGLAVDTKKRTLTNENDTYEYGKKAIFQYNDEEIEPRELEPCDLLELKMVENVVWSVEVLEYHGYIVVENAKDIKNGTFQLDEEEAFPLQDADRVPARAGAHTVCSIVRDCDNCRYRCRSGI